MTQDHSMSMSETALTGEDMPPIGAVATRVPYVNLPAQHGPIKEHLLAAVGRVIDHGRFILGPEVEEFEHRFAQLCGSKHALGVNSGTDALIMALRALDVGATDEVITVANSFVASASCIALVGARPVFVDVGDDYNIDPALIEQAITPHTKAILPVHLTGRPSDMDPIMEIARRHGLYVIEDCAQAILAEYKGRQVGSIGSIGCFSLHPLKTLNACGDGGVLTTDDSEIYEKIRILRNAGLESRDECVTWGYNSRLDTIQAAMLLVKLDHVEGWTSKRRANARFYQDLLAGVPQIEMPADLPHETSVYHTFVIRADDRDGLRAYLAKQGVGTAIHYPVPIHLQKAASGLGYKAGSFPITEKHAGRILSLPLYPELGEHELMYVVESLGSFYGLD